MTKQELQAVYFGFYDQLNEPERTEAKENWSYLFTMDYSYPNDLSDSIVRGFGWENQKQSVDYWINIHNLVLSNTYNFQKSSLTINNLTDKEVTAYMGINDALRHAETKHPNWPVNDLFKQFAILHEEIGEVSKAILEHIDGNGTIEQLRAELHQSGGMIVRILKNLRNE